jgi:uncharacterized phage protein (TIGR02216 family)
MALGLGLLRLRPRDFWAMTPVELGAALRPLFPAGGADPLRRGDLKRLMQQFPDIGGGEFG